MSETTKRDLSKVRFSSTAFPAPQDRALWESLTPAERLAILERDEEEGFRSGVAERASKTEILADVRAKRGE